MPSLLAWQIKLRVNYTSLVLCVRVSLHLCLYAWMLFHANICKTCPTFSATPWKFWHIRQNSVKGTSFLTLTVFYKGSNFNLLLKDMSIFIHHTPSSSSYFLVSLCTLSFPYSWDAWISFASFIALHPETNLQRSSKQTTWKGRHSAWVTWKPDLPHFFQWLHYCHLTLLFSLLSALLLLLLRIENTCTGVECLLLKSLWIMPQ